MGNCKCTNQQTEQPELDIKAERALQRQQHAGFIASTVIEDPFQPPVQSDPQSQSTTTANVLLLQSVIRGHLDRKRLQAVQKDWLDLEKGQSAESEAGVETREDPKALLSSEAASLLARLPAFVYRQRVRDVVHLPPQQLADGSIYVGQWATISSGLIRQGQGKLYMKDGGFIEGYWQAGKPHLLARCLFPNGDYYEGEFIQGQRSGSGQLLTFDNSLTYKGQWAYNKRNGTGREAVQDVIYEGNFLNDAKTGRGKFQWADGSWYEGDLLNGEIEGEGEYRWSDGRWYKGQWKEGKMHGNGELNTADGKRYVGEFVMDKREGRGVYKWGNNTYDGEWQDNKMHGTGYLSVGDAPRKRCEFREGSKVKELPDS